MRLCVFRWCRAVIGLNDKRCPVCGRSQVSPLARAEVASSSRETSE